MVVHSRLSHGKDVPLPTLFLDRDGVLIVERNYLADPQKVVLIPGVCEGLLAAKAAGFQLIGISNQSGIGRGYFRKEDFQKVMAKMEDLLAAEGLSLDGFYYCPHSPEDNCTCRKPLAGLLEEAAEDFHWNPALSWVVGDKLSDVRLGRNFGLGGALVDTGHGREEKARVQLEYENDSRVVFASDLKNAVEIILAGRLRKDES